MRGEKRYVFPLGSDDHESSPHARGEAAFDRVDSVAGGIIPACAGRRQTSRRQSSRRWDQPRMRGEKKHASPSSAPESGSSPHARGEGKHLAGSLHADGIIPACAGRRKNQGTYTIGIGDHPRMRGEKKGNCPFV